MTTELLSEPTEWAERLQDAAYKKVKAHYAHGGKMEEKIGTQQSETEGPPVAPHGAAAVAQPPTATSAQPRPTQDVGLFTELAKGEVVSVSADGVVIKFTNTEGDEERFYDKASLSEFPEKYQVGTSLTAVVVLLEGEHETLDPLFMNEPEVTTAQINALVSKELSAKGVDPSLNHLWRPSEAAQRTADQLWVDLLHRSRIERENER